MRTALKLAGLVLVMGGLVGCGGSDSSDGDSGDSAAMPTDASKDEFCANFQGLAEDLAKQDPTKDPSAAVQTLKDAVGKMRETGTPDGIPDDARHGLQVTLDAISSLPEDAKAGDISGLEDQLSKDERADADAFDSYLGNECGSAG
jgi:hypothetical protein